MAIGEIAAEAVIIACLVAASTFAEIRKDRKNRENSSIEHAGLKEGQAGLKEGHASLSMDIQASQQGIQHVIAEKHSVLGENLKEMKDSLKDIRDYTIAERSAQDTAAKKGIDVNELVASIKNLASVATTYADGAKTLKEEISRRDETIAHLEKQVRDLKEENKKYRDRDLMLQQMLQDHNAQNPGADEWER